MVVAKASMRLSNAYQNDCKGACLPTRQVSTCDGSFRWNAANQDVWEHRTSAYLVIFYTLPINVAGDTHVG